MGVYINKAELLKELSVIQDRPVSTAMKIIKELSTIDLVRCGECKWWDRKDKESPFGYCHAEKHCHFSNNWEICIYRTYKADHFCADGERRANEYDT